MATARKPMTADELLWLPDDGRRHELIAGELRTMAPSGEERGTVAMTVGTLLNQYVRTHRLGRVVAAETGFLLDTAPDLVRAADTAFIGRARLGDAGPGKGDRPGAPDLAVEVVSPHDRPAEVAEKVQTWLRHGARLVLVFHPSRRSVAVHRSGTEVRYLTEDDTLDGGDVVPGWRVPVRELFAPGG
jgi:Uma2 family endonuclease